jgi:O-antigen/teichoic acid export membrane protein
VGVIFVNIVYWNRSVLLPLGMPEFPAKVGFLAAAIQIAGMLILVPGGGALAMAGMMSAFFLINTGVNLWKSLKELRLAESQLEIEPTRE